MSDAENPVLAPFSNREGPIWDLLLGRVPLAPLAQFLGRTVIAIDPEAGSVACAYPVKAEFETFANTILGGMLGAMFDGTLLTALMITFQEGERAVLAEMKINFIRPAKMVTMTCTGRVVRKGRTIAFLEGDLRDGEGELIATASATAVIQARR